MFFETQFSAHKLSSIVLFVAGCGVAVLDLFLPSNGIGHLGIIMTIGGAWMHVTGGQHQIREREQMAYKLGEENGRAAVSRMHQQR